MLYLATHASTNRILPKHKSVTQLTLFFILFIFKMQHILQFYQQAFTSDINYKIARAVAGAVDIA